jgi:hypothetical protein
MLTFCDCQDESMHRSRALLTVKMHLGIHQTSFENTKDFDHADSAVKLILLLSEQQTRPKSPGTLKTWLGNSKTFVPSPWTVTGPLFGFACYLLVRPTLHYTVFGSRQPTTKAAS